MAYRYSFGIKPKRGKYRTVDVIASGDRDAKMIFNALVGQGAEVLMYKKRKIANVMRRGGK